MKNQGIPIQRIRIPRNRGLLQKETIRLMVPIQALRQKAAISLELLIQRKQAEVHQTRMVLLPIHPVHRRAVILLPAEQKTVAAHLILRLRQEVLP